MNAFKYKNFWFLFFVIFIFGNMITGLFEAFVYDVVYPYMENSNQLSDMEKRVLSLFPFLKYLIVLSYAVYSFNCLYQYVDVVKFKSLLKMFLFFYYILFVFVLTYVQYGTPISYLASCFYSEFKYGKFTDIKTFMKERNSGEKSDDVLA